MEIEKKFLVAALPGKVEKYPASYLRQWYISKEPVIRIREIDHREFVLTVKSKGDISRQEHELQLDQKEFNNLLALVATHPIEKTRYRIPLAGDLTAELDVFHGHHQGLVTVEVEFATLADAEAFAPPAWFGEDVSKDPTYKNNNLAQDRANGA